MGSWGGDWAWGGCELVDGGYRAWRTNGLVTPVSHDTGWPAGWFAWLFFFLSLFVYRLDGIWLGRMGLLANGIANTRPDWARMVAYGWDGMGLDWAEYSGSAFSHWEGGRVSFPLILCGGAKYGFRELDHRSRMGVGGWDYNHPRLLFG